MVLLVVALSLALVAVLAGCRHASADERVVVSRRGRPVRVAGPGLVWLWPVLERSGTVSLAPVSIPIVAHGTSAEGTHLVLLATLRMRVEDPIRSPDPAAPDIAFAKLAERYVTGELTGLAVDGLQSEELLARFESDLGALATTHGVVLEAIHRPELDLRL